MPRGNQQYGEGVFIPWWSIRANRRQKKGLKRALERRTEEVQVMQGRLDSMESEQRLRECLAKREFEEQHEENQNSLMEEREKTQNARTEAAALSKQLNESQLISKALTRQAVAYLLVWVHIAGSKPDPWASFASTVILYLFYTMLLHIVVAILSKFLGVFHFGITGWST